MSFSTSPGWAGSSSSTTDLAMVDLQKFSLVKQGAEARLYTGQFLGQEVVVKERFSKKYR